MLLSVIAAVQTMRGVRNREVIRNLRIIIYSCKKYCSESCWPWQWHLKLSCTALLRYGHWMGAVEAGTSLPGALPL